MRLKMECNSCGYAELVSDRRIVHCPECDATDIEFESDPLAEGRIISEAEAAVLAAEFIAVPRADPDVVPMAFSQPIRPVPEVTERRTQIRESTERSTHPLRSRSGFGLGMSEGTQI